VDGKPVIGFYRQRSHDVVKIADCLLQSEAHAPILKAVENWITKHRVSVYDEVKHRGKLRHLVIRNNDRGDLMVILVSKEPLTSVEPLVGRLIQLGVGSIYLNLNNNRGNRIFGRENRLLYGEPVLRDHIGDLSFELGPTSFFQVNPAQTVTLYEQALAFADLTGEETVFDLYAGIGTISMFLAKKAKRVITVELHEGACEDAKKNAERNGLDNVEVHQGKAEEVIPALYDQGYRADIVVVDPPRKGCDPVLLDTIVKMQPERIVYVSCKPSTLARDLGILAEQGYRTKRVRAVDMFPHTTHVETVCLLTKK
jgi:23S rRNA (uracil1939-C5)-methyltransferase